MDGIAISTERINAAGAGVTDVGHLLTGEINTMNDLLAQIRSGWQSESAAPRFAATMQGYLDEATRLTSALLGHGATLVATGGRFAEAETTVAETFAGVR